jgi:Zn-dependent oligopeptidase
MGLTGMTFYTVNVKLNEKPRKFAKAMEQAQLDSMKYTLDEEEEIERLKAEMQGATRKVEEIINKSQPWEWGYWADRAKVVPNMLLFKN